jgi:hypothetical protein
MGGFTAFSEMLLGKGRLKALRLAAVLVFAGAFSSFWYNPAFFLWMITGPMGEEIRGTISRLIPMSFFIVPVLGTLGFLLFDRKPDLQPVFLASFSTIAFAVITLAGGGFFPSHPSRYSAEFGISLSLFLAVAIVKLSDYLRFSPSPFLARINRSLLANGILICAFVLVCGGIVLGRGQIIYKENVLGVWTGVEKGSIWEAKDRFGGASSILGYTITSFAVLGLGALSLAAKERVNV